MAIVKGKYTRNRQSIKASVRYISHRPGRDGEKMSRELFGFDGTMTRQQAYRMIDAMKTGSYFYRLVLSTDPRFEDTFKDLDLSLLATRLMAQLEERLLSQN